MVGERYKIMELLGQGGMGAVYHAWDRELDREVALKVIRPEMAANPQLLNRFKQELILARQITHRNVIRIFDLGQADGLRFITMEFIAGEDLQALRKREKKLAPERAAQIMVQVCGALEAAHAEGVVHRDLKPQNIMLGKDGRAYVMDFGVARSLLGEGMTETGALIGTPDYMSPEQAKGLPVDARSDIFSFGIIFYELLCGQNPFDADTPMEKLWKRTSTGPRPLSELDKSLPQGLTDVINGCLEIDREKRTASATELLRQVREWQGPAADERSRAKRSRMPMIGSVVATAAALAVLIAVILRPRIAVTPPKHAPVTMLIADFENNTGDPIFSQTLEPMLAVALESAPFISTYDRGTARKTAAELQPDSTAIDAKLAQLVAQREGVGIVLSGSIAPGSRGGYTVNVTTLDAGTGKPVMKDEHVSASSKEDMLSVAKTIAQDIRKGLGDTVPEGAQQLAAETFTATSLIAAHDYAEGQFLQQQGKLVAAIASYRRALGLDPNMGRAYAGIAACSQNLGRITEAEENYKLALARIDRMTDREKYRTRSGYYLLMQNNSKAMEELALLEKEYPADVSVHANLAFAYFSQRNMSKALEEQKQELAIVPNAVLQRSNFSLYALYAGDFQTTIHEAQEILKDNPNFDIAQRTLAVAQLASGQVENARQSFLKLQTMSAQGAAKAETGLADLALYEGRLTEAEDLLQEAVSKGLSEKNSDTASDDGATLALTQLALGKTAQARSTAMKAAKKSKNPGVLYRAAQVFLETGDRTRALATVAPLATRIEGEPQLYARLIAGEAQLKSGNARVALTSFQEAQKLADSWLVHNDMGLAYLQLASYSEASTEFATCLKRRGEATAVFLDDIPSYHLLPPVYYYLGRAQQGLNDFVAARESYSTYLGIKDKSEGDPLAADARKRLSTGN